MRKTSIGGGEKSDNLKEPQRCSSELINSVISTVGTDKAIDNLRVQRLLGINRMDGKATLDTIPEGKDRSMFSCKRYQFFLDAPFEISNRCCTVMKKAPAHEYAKKTGRMPITAQMASESRLRTQVWLKQGCNAFDANQPISNPMAFWFENDVLEYIYRNNIEICSVYGEVVKENEVKGQLDWDDLGIFDIGKPVFKTTGCERTGCVFCGYGCHREKSPSRFERLHITHPKLYNYVMRPWSEGGLGYKEVIDWINEHGNLDIRY